MQPITNSHAARCGLDLGLSRIGFPESSAQVLPTRAGGVMTPCAWLDIGGAQLAWGKDSHDRVAFVTLSGDLVAFSLPMNRDSILFICGEPVRFGQIACHLPGDRLHERCQAGAEWVRIYVPAAALRADGGAAVALPCGIFPLRRLTPPMGRLAGVLDAVRHAMALGGGRTGNTVKAEAAALGLHRALAACCHDTRPARTNVAARRRHDVMVRFQDYMAFWCERPVHIPDICAALDVPARTLEDYCQAQCGVSAYRLLRLFRLHQVHEALAAATPSTGSVTAASRRFGFLDLGRFAATYRAAFDELPSQTLARTPLDLGRPPVQEMEHSVGMT